MSLSPWIAFHHVEANHWIEHFKDTPWAKFAYTKEMGIMFKKMKERLKKYFDKNVDVLKKFARNIEQNDLKVDASKKIYAPYIERKFVEDLKDMLQPQTHYNDLFLVDQEHGNYDRECRMFITYFPNEDYYAVLTDKYYASDFLLFLSDLEQNNLKKYNDFMDEETKKTLDEHGKQEYLIEEYIIHGHVMRYMRLWKSDVFMSAVNYVNELFKRPTCKDLRDSSLNNVGSAYAHLLAKADYSNDNYVKPIPFYS